MRNNLNITFKLDRLACYDEADGWGSAEPYMWTVFFKIDGTTCRLNDALMLEGTATVFTTPGSHGNLGNTDVDEDETISVPSAIGLQDLSVTPIPVPDFVKKLGTDDVAGVAGCIVVLMEEDNVSDDGAESGHQALNASIQNALNSLIPTLGFTNQEITDEAINNLTGQVQAQVEAAVQNQQGFFENLWSWLNADDTIGTVVWKFSSDQLLNQNPITLRQRWTNDNGDWELFGNINTVEVPTCPAEVVESIFDRLFGASASKESMQAMYRFRDTEMNANKGLYDWWQIAQRNSRYLASALTDKEVSEAAFTLFRDVPQILNNKEKPLSELHFNHIEKVLRHISTLNTTDRHSRKGIRRATDALQTLRGKSLDKIFETLSKVKPARYPSLNNLDKN